MIRDIKNGKEKLRLQASKYSDWNDRECKAALMVLRLWKKDGLDFPALMQVKYGNITRAEEACRRLLKDYKKAGWKVVGYGA